MWSHDLIIVTNSSLYTTESLLNCSLIFSHSIDSFFNTIIKSLIDFKLSKLPSENFLRFSFVFIEFNISDRFVSNFTLFTIIDNASSSTMSVSNISQVYFSYSSLILSQSIN